MDQEEAVEDRARRSALGEAVACRMRSPGDWWRTSGVEGGGEVRRRGEERSGLWASIRSTSELFRWRLWPPLVLVLRPRAGPAAAVLCDRGPTGGEDDGLRT